VQLRQPSRMSAFRRLSLVIAAYLLSSLGVVAMIILVGSGEIAGSRVRIPLLACLTTAWGVHLVMSFAWVFGRRLHRAWPTIGTYAAVLAIIIVPASALIDPGSHGLFTIATLGALAIGALIPVAPCVFLGVHLVRYHSQSPVLASIHPRVSDA